MAENSVQKMGLDYGNLLQELVAIIKNARLLLAQKIATISSNVHWQIGKILFENKIDSKNGGNVIKRLSVDLKEKFPDMGTSPRQLWSMKQFFERYMNCEQKVLQSVALLSWRTNLLLLNKRLDDDATVYYATEVVSKGWNYDMLLNAIKMGMHKNAPSKPSDNNFADVLPVAQAEYANEIFRSTYNLGFLGITKPILETELEQRLVEKVKQFLLELGKGFTYIGNQWELEYNGKTSRVDMLFFHRGLHSLVAIDLKIGEFKPEYAGKMNYYLSLLDRLERRSDENRSIGIILCAEKDRVEVELALEDINKPIGVADYQLIIPKEELQKVLSEEIKSFEKENNRDN